MVTTAYLSYVLFLNIWSLVFQPGALYTPLRQTVFNIWWGFIPKDQCSVSDLYVITDLITNGPCYITQLISIVTSALSIHRLLSHTAPTATFDRRRRSSIKVLVANFGGICYTVVSVTHLVLITTYSQDSPMERGLFVAAMVNAVILPLVLSVFNPIVYLVCTPR